MYELAVMVEGHLAEILTLTRKPLKTKNDMDFKDQIKQLGDRVTKLKEQIQTEEAAKNAFIVPFYKH